MDPATNATAMIAQVLQRSIMSDAHRAEAEAQLKQWEVMPGFHSTLMDISLNPIQPASIRHLAVIMLKTAVDRYWRPRQKGPELYRVILHAIKEAFTAPMAMEQERGRYAQLHSLHVLHRVIKVLSIKQHIRFKTIKYQLTPELFRYLSGIYYDNIEAFFAGAEAAISGTADVKVIEHRVEVARRALKSLRTLIVYGYPEQKEKKFEYKAPFFEAEDPTTVLRANAANPYIARLHGSVNKLTSLIGKQYKDLAENRVVGFCLSRGSMDVVKFYWQQLSYFDVNTGNDCRDFDVIPEQKLPGTATAQDIIANQLLTPDFVSSAAEVLITKYLKLGIADLQKWEEEPESFVTDEEADHWEFSLRLCAQKALYDLVNRFRSHLAPLFVSLLHRVKDIGATSDDASMLFKESVYSVFAICANDLYDSFPFAELLQSKLIPEVQELRPHRLSKIMRRRTSLLIHSCINIYQIPDTLLPEVYRTLLTLALPSEVDLVVRLTAIAALKPVVEENITNADAFESFAGGAMETLMAVLATLDEFETKVIVMKSLESVVYLLRERVTPYVGGITSRLPELWNSSEHQKIFRIAILDLLQALIVTDNIFEDAVSLWYEMVHNATEATPALITLYPLVHDALEVINDLDRFPQVLKIFEAYFLLCPAPLLQLDATASIFVKLQGLVHSMAIQASKFIAKTLTKVLRTCARAGQLQALCGMLAATGVLECCVREILRAGGDERRVDHIIADFCTVIGVIGVWEGSFLITFLRQLGAEVHEPGGLVGMVIDQWSDVYEAMTYARQRKITTMALGSMLATGDRDVLTRAPLIFASFFDSLSQVFEKTDEEAQQHWFEQVDDGDGEETAGLRRMREVQSSDPITTTSLTDFIRGKLIECEAAVGGSEAFKALVLGQVDTRVLAERLIGRLLSSTTSPASTTASLVSAPPPPKPNTKPSAGSPEEIVVDSDSHDPPKVEDSRPLEEPAWTADNRTQSMASQLASMEKMITAARGVDEIQRGYIPTKTAAATAAAAEKARRRAEEGSNVVLADGEVEDDAGEEEARPMMSREAAERQFLRQHRQHVRPGSELNPNVGGNKPVTQRQHLESKVPKGMAKAAGAVRIMHAREDAQRYKTPTQSLWEDYWVTRPTLENFESLVDEQISRARRRGDFENLQGRGKPLDLNSETRGNPFLSETEVIMNNMVKNQGHLPAWVEMGKDVDVEVAKLRTELAGIWDECFPRREEAKPAVSAQATSLGPSPQKPKNLTDRILGWITGDSGAGGTMGHGPSREDRPRRGGGEAEWARRAPEWADIRVKEINGKIRSYNLSVPSGVGQKVAMAAKSELERARREGERRSGESG
ncbi:Importin-11 [Irineochytrium annulatum]|nr:Importin-11 [Irineochytrium annulatum]